MLWAIQVPNRRIQTIIPGLKVKALSAVTAMHILIRPSMALWLYMISTAVSLMPVTMTEVTKANVRRLFLISTNWNRTRSNIWMSICRISTFSSMLHSRIQTVRTARSICFPNHISGKMSNCRWKSQAITVRLRSIMAIMFRDHAETVMTEHITWQDNITEDASGTEAILI